MLVVVERLQSTLRDPVAAGRSGWERVHVPPARRWAGPAVILGATLFFFSPLLPVLGSYSEGGDSMFNAWTLARNHHCLLGDGCPSYVDGNIYHPHPDTMLYSETQLSAGVLTLPLRLVTDNPLVPYHLWTIASFLFAGWFMYALARWLSGGHEVVSVLAGLVYAFAPFKMSAVSHLQNLSTFYLPLAVLFLLRFMAGGRRRHLAGLFVVLVLQFYASWYQMVFVLGAMVVLLLAALVGRMATPRQVLVLALVVAGALVATLPLAREYVRFSGEKDASFTVRDQALYAADLVDYVLPHDGTLAGRVYYALRPDSQRNAFNPDSFSYHGIVLYALGAAVVAGALLRRRAVTAAGEPAPQGDGPAPNGDGSDSASGPEPALQRPEPAAPGDGPAPPRDGPVPDSRAGLRAEHVPGWAATFAALFVVGLVVSLGPVLKVAREAHALLVDPGAEVDGLWLPYALVNTFVPQLSFIRAIGRASVLCLLALCCLLALAPRVFGDRDPGEPDHRDRDPGDARRRRRLAGLLVVLLAVELLPLHRMDMVEESVNPYSYRWSVPAVYEVIRDRDDIDRIIVLAADADYPNAPIPVARAEWVLWAGYHNKRIFNGYSGYTPPNYDHAYLDFVDFGPDDLPRLAAHDLHYVLVDKLLSTSDPDLAPTVARLLPDVVYEDDRHLLARVGG